ncbi:MAG: carboxypeptidase regulatory-like domain-containing protein [Planctomycetota bacterium]
MEPADQRGAVRWWLLGLVAVLLASLAVWGSWLRRTDGDREVPTGSGAGPLRAKGEAPAELAPHLRVRGRVLAPDGSPAEGADVALFHLAGAEPVLPPPDPAAVFHTGREGTFAFDVARGPDLAVGARMPGFISMLVPVVDARRELVLRLADAYEVRGYVSEYFAPVEGCEVVLEAEDDRLSRVTRTGADGAFRFTEVYPGLVTLSARTAMYRPAVRTGIVVGSSEPLRLQFHEAALAVLGHVWLDEQATVPAAGASVRATLQRGEGARRHGVPHTAVVAPDGSFRLLGLGPGMHRVEVAHPERSTAVRMLDVDPRLPADLDVRLVPRAPVRGRLAGGESTSAELLLVTEAGERARTRADTGGRFEFPGTLSVGPASLVLLDRSVCFERSSSRRVQIEVGADTATTLTVAPTLLLVGDVADPSGKPIAGAEVYVDSERMPGIDLLREPAAVTDAEGGYHLHVASNAALELTFEHPRYATLTQRLPRDASGVQQTVTLHPPSRILGQVVRDGQPLPAAIVHLATEGPMRGWATTGPDGSFILHGVPPGEHELFVRYGTLSERSTLVQVEPARDPKPVLLTLPPGRILEGVVLDGQRRPVEGALVSIDGAAGIAVNSDAAGRFALDAPRGEVVVRAFAPGWRLQETRQVPAEGVDVEIVLPLPPHGRLIARVQGLSGQTLRGALLTLAPAGVVRRDVARSGRSTHWVDLHDGKLDFDRLPIGDWSLALRCSGYAPFVVERSVREGAAVDLGVCRLEPGARVRGVVLDEAGRQVPAAQVLLGSEADALVVSEASRVRGDDLFGVRADLRGRFELSGVSSRATTLVVLAPGFAPQEVAVRLPADLLRRDPLPITLTRGVDVVVQVVDAGGQPVSGRMVELGRDGFSVDVGRTDADGRCVFHSCSRGEYRVGILGTPVEDTVEVLQQQTYHVPLRLDDR